MHRANFLRIYLQLNYLYIMWYMWTETSPFLFIFSVVWWFLPLPPPYTCIQAHLHTHTHTHTHTHRYTPHTHRHHTHTHTHAHTHTLIFGHCALLWWQRHHGESSCVDWMLWTDINDGMERCSHQDFLVKQSAAQLSEIFFIQFQFVQLGQSQLHACSRLAKVLTCCPQNIPQKGSEKCGWQTQL